MQQLIDKLSLNKKTTLTLIAIILLGAFLRFYKLSELMQFIGDQGWFYWSAKQLLVDNQIPLVGIASSHPWIHQGALWTYILAAILTLFDYNPFIPAYFVAFLGIVTILIVYLISKEMFSRRVALISSFLFAVSPLVINESRLAYHTAPIPTVSILFIYFIYKCIKDDKRFFPISVFLVGILYNLEIATFTLIGTFALIILYGFVRRKKWAMGLLNVKILLFSAIALLIPMIPMIIYDLSHGFPQTLKFVVWVFYKIFLIFGFSPIHSNPPGETWKSFAIFNIDVVRHIIFLPSGLISVLFLLFVLLIFIYLNYKSWLHNKIDLSSAVLLVFLVIPTLAFLSQKTNSGAYLSMLFPQWIILIALTSNQIMKKYRATVIISLFFVFIALLNSYILIKNNYFVTTNINDKLKVSKQIIQAAGITSYDIVGKGNGSQYESFITPYEYLTWYLGNPPSTRSVRRRFYVSEYPDRINLEVAK